ncbi:MAG: translation initiation factor IF-2 [Treponema sp.]|jgi:translation initiation factor IF-2|nr:translation initiation factor IF-2 [Treponema sp.]
MAEEIASIQKPKVELIKRPKNEQEAPEGGGKTPSSPEHGERRKVVVVKKKTIAQPAPVPVAAKKTQPKIVVATHGDAREEVPAEPVKAPPPAPVVEQVTPEPPVKTEVPVKTEAPVQEEVKPAVPPVSRPEERPVSVFPNTQRPAAAAGRVGGRFVGPRPPREEPSPSVPHRSQQPPFAQRPVGAAGRVGGRPVGNRPGQEGGFNGNRSGGQNRPFVPSHQGPRGPGGSGRPGGFTGPRPGGIRPGMNRPGTGMAPKAPPLIEGKGPIKKTFKPKKAVYQRKEQEMEEKLLQTKKKIALAVNPVPKSIDIMEVVSVSELARKMNLKASDLIQKLMSMGMMVTINQQIDADTAAILAAEFGADVKIVSLYEETVIATETDEEESKMPRPPVVTVMGHVDHGKTKLLDAIRSADVVAGDFGGITQHIGAYTVDTPAGKITFLDTPGHEAFTRMRARGAQVTDIVILVVAADDGVMPQTIEAINHAKEADVPIIVAVNKIDKPEANPDRVKSQLSELGLMPEDWGGQTMFVELSALRKEGIDKLIENILLQAELLDLKANYNRSAEGKVLESRIDHGRGIVATVMVERGTLGIGDPFVAGIWPGRVRALFNDKGERVEEATPSMPVEVLGFEGIPNAGDPLQVVDDGKVAQSISAKRQEFKRFEDAKNIKKITMDNLHDMISDGAIQELKVIIKSDVQGSAEALRSSLEKLSNKEVRLSVIQALPGPINEGDVDLAAASNAIIIGFNVRPLPKAKILADQEKVDIRKYNIIYKAVEEIQQAMEGMLKPDTKEEVIATVEVRNTFKTPKAGTIAGCYVLTGTVKRSASVNVIRDEIVIHTGKIASLRRFKDDVREVAAGYECGLGIEGFDTVQVDDQLEVFEIVEVARKLNS